MIPGVGSLIGAGASPSFQGGAASGGTSANRMGDWQGSQINMGGGSKSADVLFYAFIIVAAIPLIIWGMSTWRSRKR